MIKTSTIFSLIALFLFANCDTKNNSNDMNIVAISNVKLENLSKKKIYFGHQSVGYNLIDGLQDIIEKNQDSSIRIIEGNDVELFNDPVIAHAQNGMNRDPNSKIKNFQQTLDKGLGNKVDIAGFKFCYVDFNKSTDVDELFQHYKETMTEISNEYPDISLVHFTVPLRTVQGGIKGPIKRIFSNDINLLENEIRQKFNEMVVGYYDEESVFDIAKLESTFQNGKRNFKNVDGKRVYSMVSEYSNDGGHLSMIGKEYLGNEFLIFLTK